MSDTQAIFDVVVIGAGAAGIGVGVALQHAGIDRFVIVDRFEVGASFDRWPSETRLITPSFPTNSIGMLDLNSIAIGVSPGYSLQTEHPTGREYAAHLRAVAQIFNLPLKQQTCVLRVSKIGSEFKIDTIDETLRAKHVIWAAGEFQYPQLSGLPGIKHCVHTAMVSSYADLPGDDFVVIGGYESGIDAAYHLAKQGKDVRVFDVDCPWGDLSSDPSVSLSVFTKEKIREDVFRKYVQFFAFTPVLSVQCIEDRYQVQASGDLVFTVDTPPLFAGGFAGSHGLVADLFDHRDDGYPQLTSEDESTIVPGLFLCGPSVRHDDHIFCFIYKFRQRFAVVAKAIANSLRLPAADLEMYRNWGMYLDNLSCCGEECVC